MGHAERLLLPRDGGQLAPDLLRRVTGHAGIDLVKNQHTNIFARCQYVFEREHDAAQLAAGGDSGERLFRLTRIDRDLERHGVKAVRGQLGPGVHGDAHADLVHIQLGKLAHDLLFELFRRRAPRLGQLGCNALGLAEHFAVLPAKLLAAVVRILKRVKLCRGTPGSPVSYRRISA